MFLLLHLGLLSFQRVSLKAVTVVIWVLGALGTFPARVAQAAWEMGGFLNPGGFCKAWGDKCPTPFNSCWFTWHLNLAIVSSSGISISPILNWGGQARYNLQTNYAFIHSLLYAFMHLFFTICIHSLFTVYIHSFFTKCMFIGRRHILCANKVVIFLDLIWLFFKNMESLFNSRRFSLLTIFFFSWLTNLSSTKAEVSKNLFMVLMWCVLSIVTFHLYLETFGNLSPFLQVSWTALGLV